jgi:hypothetical protein
MAYYQHDAGEQFRFQIVGHLDEAVASDLEQAWSTAAPIIRGKRLVVDITAMEGADGDGEALLARFRDSGATFIGASTHAPAHSSAGGAWRHIVQAFRSICPDNFSSVTHR